MDKNFLLTGAVLVVVGVVLGAFGAHGLKKVLDASALTSFETGVRYQIYHGLAMLFLGLLASSSKYVASGQSLSVVFYVMLCGVILFSGSIYLLSTRAISGVDFSRIGFITPIGGLSLIISWCILCVQLYRLK